MTPDLMELVGRALFGDQWQRALARELQIGERLMRRYKAGHRPLPVDMDVALLNLMDRRIRALQDLHRALSPGLSVAAVEKLCSRCTYPMKPNGERCWECLNPNCSTYQEADS